jgi:DNA-binding GntR family transcriptional regulator
VTTKRGKDTAAQSSSGRKRTQVAQQIGLPRQAGSFAHYSVAQEIGRRIVSGDYPPGSILRVVGNVRHQPVGRA